MLWPPQMTLSHIFSTLTSSLVDAHGLLLYSPFLLLLIPGIRPGWRRYRIGRVRLQLEESSICWFN